MLSELPRRSVQTTCERMLAQQTAGEAWALGVSELWLIVGEGPQQRQTTSRQPPAQARPSGSVLRPVHLSRHFTRSASRKGDCSRFFYAESHQSLLSVATTIAVKRVKGGLARRGWVQKTLWETRR